MDLYKEIADGKEKTMKIEIFERGQVINEKVKKRKEKR